MCGKERCAECPAPKLLPDALPAVAAYGRCGTQWRYAAHGFGSRLTGLDYTACRPAVADMLRKIRGAGVVLDVDVGDVMEDLHAIEIGVLSVQQERLEAETPSE